MSDFPAEYDLEVVRGADFARTFTWWPDLPDDARWLTEEWESTRTYARHEAVAFGAHRYLALEQSTGAQPDTSPSQWDQLTPTDLSGYTAALHVKKGPGSPTDLSLTGGSGIALGGTAGTIAIAITDTQTAGLVQGCYRYGLFVTSGGDTTTPFLTGEFRVKDAGI